MNEYRRILVSGNLGKKIEISIPSSYTKKKKKKDEEFLPCCPYRGPGQIPNLEISHGGFLSTLTVIYYTS